jgi:shikimate kinase
MLKKGDHIILIGMSGSGKTALGEALSIALNLPFIDTDEEIVKMTGLSISEIFRLEGEAKFRSYESGVIRQLVDFPKSVIAVGGGLPCHNNQMDLILDMGKVIYLNVYVDVLVSRLIEDQNERPLYAKLSKEEIIKKTIDLKAEREDAFKKAHFVIDANQAIDAVVQEIIEKLI